MGLKYQVLKPEKIISTLKNSVLILYLKFVVSAANIKAESKSCKVYW
jgi:hypothetical protein